MLKQCRNVWRQRNQKVAAFRLTVQQQRRWDFLPGRFQHAAPKLLEEEELLEDEESLEDDELREFGLVD